MKLLRYSFKELTNHPRLITLFLINMALGLSGFIALDYFQRNINDTLKSRSKLILGADIGISSRKSISDAQQELVDTYLQKFKALKTKTIETYSMVSNKLGKSRLVQVKAIENNYPFYGKIHLQPEDPGLFSRKVMWVYPELAAQLKLKPGDEIKLGNEVFTLGSIVLDDSASGITTSMAPRIFISLSNLKGTGLVREGSLIWTSYLYKIPDRSTEELDTLRDEIFKKLNTEEIQVFTHENVSDMVGRLLGYMNDFLNLASICALFLAGIGSSYLFRSYLASKYKTMAILFSQGFSHRQVFTHYLFQSILLGMVSSLFAIVLSATILPFLNFIAENLVSNSTLVSTGQWQTWALALVVGTLSCLFITLPQLSKVFNVRPNFIFSQSIFIDKETGWRGYLLYLPCLLLFLGLSVWKSHSIKNGISFFAFVFIATICFLIIGQVFIIIGKKLGSIKSLSLRLALKNALSYKVVTLSTFTCLSLGTLLLNLIPQIQASISKELESPDDSILPSLFLFDIQEDQIKALSEMAKHNMKSSSPMIRARLVSVNDKAFETKDANQKSMTREQEKENRFRNRGFNISYRENLSSSEFIEEGVFYKGTYSNADQSSPEISLEIEFAKRLNLKIGDQLTFDIQGVDIRGIVTSFRKVRWTSFEPNFFILFQPGVLEPAPKTYVTSLFAENTDTKLQLQDQIVEKFPNISIIDVTKVVAKLQFLIDQMAWALKFISALSLMAGLTVLYSIIDFEARNSNWMIGIMKSLGFRHTTLNRQYLIQYGLISLLAVSFGTSLSFAASFFLTRIIFQTNWDINWAYPLISASLIMLCTLIVTYLGSRKALLYRPSQLLTESL